MDSCHSSACFTVTYSDLGPYRSKPEDIYYDKCKYCGAKNGFDIASRNQFWSSYCGCTGYVIENEKLVYRYDLDQTPYKDYPWYRQVHNPDQ